MITIKKLFFFAALICLPLAPSLSQSKAKNEKIDSGKLKAVWIYNFTQNIYWSQEDKITTFRICVLNSPDLAKYLNLIAEARKFRNETPIKIISITNVSQIPPCEMLVVDGAGKDNLWSAYTKIRYRNTLMVAENLADYAKSMISFIEVDGKIQFIINQTKIDEANLTVGQKLYASGITKETEWKSIFDKLDNLLKSKNGNAIELSKAEMAELMKLYKKLQAENKGKGLTITQMEDSIRKKAADYEKQMQEYGKVVQKIDNQKKVLEEQENLMKEQKSEIFYRETLISKQKNVIMLIGALSVVALILFMFALRSTYLRNKANKVLVQQRNEIAQQKHLVDEKQKEIVDSINYAKRIQTALLANDRLLSNNLPKHFVFYRPKDIVAGDFYWASRVEDGFMYITADCTGHGVPGAFMSLLNISKLSETINQKRITRPDLVLNDVKAKIIQALNPEDAEEESKDGMDATLVNLDRRNMKLRYAAANNSFCIVRQNQILEYKADKMPVGKSYDDSALFTYNEIDLESGDMIYTYTDGFADQFGGEKGKKFKQKQLKELMLSIAQKTMSEQKEAFGKAFEEWKGDLEQVDDVLVIGVRV